MDTREKIIKDFAKWVRVQLALKDMTQKSLAQKMGVAYPRISEAVHFRGTGKAYIKDIIRSLDGDIKDFKDLLDLE